MATTVNPIHDGWSAVDWRSGPEIAAGWAEGSKPSEVGASTTSVWAEMGALATTKVLTVDEEVLGGH
jgi:hypothetical protein